MTRIWEHVRWVCRAGVMLLAAWVAGCGADNATEEGGAIRGDAVVLGAQADTAGAASSDANSAGATQNGTASDVSAAGAATTGNDDLAGVADAADPAGGSGAAMVPTAQNNAGVTPAGGGGAGAGGSAGTQPLGSVGGGATQPTAGPEDGDPNGPIVEVPGLACGENPSLFGLTTPNTTIGGREVHVAYPCNKHAGAPVTFILNLHGTMQDESLKLYQVAYFSANNLVNSHNFITVAPKSVVSQWGNGDGGVDEPHIMEVIDWVYSSFKDFDIRAMWVSGHSWGAMYSTNFVCKPELADKVRGAILESGSGVPPTCSSNLSVISTAAENDIGPTIDQTTIAAGHGCGAAQMNMIGNNIETLWPDCDNGFVHGSYLMLGKAHADYMDADLVEHIGDLINLSRP